MKLIACVADEVSRRLGNLHIHPICALTQIRRTQTELLTPATIDSIVAEGTLGDAIAHRTCAENAAAAPAPRFVHSRRAATYVNCWPCRQALFKHDLFQHCPGASKRHARSLSASAVLHALPSFLI